MKKPTKKPPKTYTIYDIRAVTEPAVTGDRIVAVEVEKVQLRNELGRWAFRTVDPVADHGDYRRFYYLKHENITWARTRKRAIEVATAKIDAAVNAACEWTNWLARIHEEIRRDDA